MIYHVTAMSESSEDLAECSIWPYAQPIGCAVVQTTSIDTAGMQSVLESMHYYTIREVL